MVVFSMPISVVTLGVLNGAGYALLAVGMVLLFRSSRVINFALAECGLFGAALLALAHTRWHFPYLAALAVGLAGAAGASMLVEVAVVRRLSTAPRAIGIVATIGAAQFLVMLSAIVTPSNAGGVRYPVPSFLPEITVGTLRLAPGYVALLLTTPVIVVALAAVLRFTDLGIGIRAAASNRQAARLSGISAARMSSASWALAGVLAGVLAVFILPTRGVSAAQQVGPALLLRALTAAVLARMDRLMLAGVAAVGLGVLEQGLYFNVDNRGVADLAILALLLVALLVQRDPAGRGRPSGAWAAVTAVSWPPLNELGRQRARRLRGIALGLLVLCAWWLASSISNSGAASLGRLLSLAVVAMGLVIVTGLSGQVSLGQLAIAGIAGGCSARVAAGTGNVLLGAVVGVTAAIVVAVLLGLPALRLQGPFLAATTLGAAVVATQFVLPELLGTGVHVGQPVIAGVALDSGRRYLPVTIVALGIAIAVVAVVRRSALGRNLRAARDNIEAARAMGIRTSATVLTGFAISGALAGLGGVVLAHSQAVVVPGMFPLSDNTSVMAAAVIGGLGSTLGPVFGALYVVGVPLFVPLDSAGLAATALGWLLLLLYVPSGLLGIAHSAAGVLATRLNGGAPALDDAPGAISGAAVVMQPAGQVQRRGAALHLDGVCKSYGGVQAVGGVTFELAPGSVTAIIGANGAGKTTLFELIAGAVQPDGGAVRLDGRAVESWSSARRARCGLVRSFQDAALFPALTARECVMVALSSQRLSRHELSARAAHLLARFGLTGYGERRVNELSTGTRRILDFTCCAALQPRLLLLDEPAAGVAQRDVEALVPVIRALAGDGACTVVVIEHDMALVRSLAERVIAMETGLVIADGTAADVFNHPDVVSSYLGTDAVALARSGQATT